MSVLGICKFDEDLIKKNEVAIIWTKSSPLYVCGRLKGSYLNSPICPKIELIQDFMAVPITCKSDEDTIKNVIAIVRTTCSKVYEALKVGGVGGGGEGGGW